MTRSVREPLLGLALADDHNSRQRRALELRAKEPTAVLHHCLASYISSVANGEPPLENITRHLTQTFSATEQAIRIRMETKWADSDGDAARSVSSSVTNSLRRSAGTNYQALVAYAISTALQGLGSHWYTVHPVPREWGKSLAIRFGGAVVDESDTGEESTSVVVDPDLDVLLRNASWDAASGEPEPVLVLSVKTSLADRAGAAARWKTYFDLVTQPCAHVCDPTCAYKRLGIELAANPNVAITHGIVTANIYKMNSDPNFAKYGELRSNQAKSNTFMFDLRFTTRTNTPEVMAEGWQSLTNLLPWLAATSQRHNLPQ